MRKIRIGLPRALAYHRYHVLWKTFFTKLGCYVIVSPETHNEIINIGINNIEYNFCLPYKIFIGHVLYLNNYCDYILISNICSNNKKEKICPALNNTYNVVKMLIPKEKILNHNISYSNPSFLIVSFIKIGLKLTKNPIRIIYSYIYAQNKQKKYNLEKENEARNKLFQSKKTVLLISHFYNLEDKFIAGYIKNYLSNKDITYILSNTINPKLAEDFSEYFTDSIPLKYSKEILGAMCYYQEHLDGIIFISSKSCTIDAFINTLATLKNKALPIINIEVDEIFNEKELKEVLNSFITSINKGRSK